MKPELLKKWMRVNDKTIIDIASALRIAPQTVTNYLKGKNVHRSTKAAIERLLAPVGDQKANNAVLA